MALVEQLGRWCVQFTAIIMALVCAAMHLYNCFRVFFPYFCPYLLDFVYAGVSKSDRIVDTIPACLSLI